ncbi:SDR family oxidoreductase [Flexivirga sp. ID2601S]|uniref:SDR family oxidoreductase n=1 Tax=Flexivirga aerilata TaxID=1656889 RepID=A0A849ARX2_9MICO|nr:UDP-glucuronic acid decarboxylase family protein [Flexivirga aerilata]NNG41030.1 SDR family oxidoreductase [Flexivirga aerilata]
MRTQLRTPASDAGPDVLRRAVVAGGAGFLGSHVCDALRARGVEVLCLDNFLTGTARNVAHLLPDPGFRLVRCDVTDYVHVPGPVDLVMHLASPASPADYLRLPLQTLKAGSLGTWHLLGLAKEKDARFVLASTSEVYGDPSVHPQPESYWGNVNSVGPRAVYDESKRYAEALSAAYRSSASVDSAIVRIFNTFGPRMRADDGRAIPTFITQALAGEPLTVAGDGLQTRSVCYVDDLVDGLLAMAAGEHPGPVNLGNPDERTVLDLARDIIAATGSRSAVQHIERPQDDPSVRRPDVRLAEQVLGWRPRVAWRDGLDRTVAWWRAAGHLGESVRPQCQPAGRTAS